jgi:hypothetical protein
MPHTPQNHLLLLLCALLSLRLRAGVPRANKAVSVETPNGSPAHLAREDYTVMQQHVAFFDRWGIMTH